MSWVIMPQKWLPRPERSERLVLVKVCLCGSCEFECGEEGAAEGGAGEQRAVDGCSSMRSRGISTTVRAWIDFDRVLEDPANPGHVLPAFDCGDHLHLKYAGYKAMAKAHLLVGPTN